MKTTQKQFQLFKQECEKWIDKLELHNWSVHYQHCPLRHSAQTTSDYLGMVATIGLNTEWDNGVRQLNDEEIAKSAKHEIIHLLLAKLDILASSRFISSNELDHAEHEIVRKLEHIL
jgi:hypothetical protein